MTRDEWYGLCAFINELFAQPLPPEKAEIYFEFVAEGVDEKVMRAAIRRLVNSGARFLPAAGELAAACQDVTGALAPGELDAPSFSEVIGVVDGARYLPKPEAVARVTERCGPVAAAWMCAEGIDALKGMELAHPEYGASVRRDLERRWKAFVDGQRDRARRGLPLAQATERGRLASGGLRRMDFHVAGQLPQGGEAA